jgi:hypothetical protein
MMHVDCQSVFVSLKVKMLQALCYTVISCIRLMCMYLSSAASGKLTEMKTDYTCGGKRIDQPLSQTNSL